MNTDRRVTDKRYRSIQQATLTDETLVKLMHTILSGWPLSAADVPAELVQYWTFRDELAILDGIVYKGTKIIIPTTLRRDTMERLHSSHQGTAATLRRARLIVYWPNMALDIENHIGKCVRCQMDAPQQQAETIRHHDIPDKLWNKVGMDLFMHNNNDYLIVVDYLSDFFEVEQLLSTSSYSVIQACKKTFARHGIPELVHSDNGPQFTSHEFQKFSNTWEFNHSTSSPYHSKSDGKAEAAVKVAKRVLKRAADPFLALLEIRNTPTQGMTTSPAQRLLGRETRSILPQTSSVTDDIQTVLQEKNIKRTNSQKQYNKSAKDLPALKTGTPILLRDFNSHKTSWQKGRIIEQLSDRSYSLMNAEGNLIRRNRIDIRPLTEETPTELRPSQEHSVIKERHEHHQGDTVTRDVSRYQPITNETLESGTGVTKERGNTHQGNPGTRSVTKDSVEIQGDTPLLSAPITNLAPGDNASQTQANVSGSIVTRSKGEANTSTESVSRYTSRSGRQIHKPARYLDN